MPKEIRDVEEFIRLSEKAEYCLVKKAKKEDTVKLKIRTKRYLYTLKTNLKKLTRFLKTLNVR